MSTLNPSAPSHAALATDLAEHVVTGGKPRIVVARKADYLPAWLAGPADGRLTTYWDVHPNGPTTGWERSRAEREARLRLTPETVYGTLVIEREHTPATSRFDGDSFYGSIAFVVDDLAAARATLTPGDTIDNDFASTSPFSEVTDVVREALVRRPALLDELGAMPIDQAREAAALLFENPGNTTLVEAQIHALRRGEIAEARSRFYNTSRERAVLMAARDAGIAVPPYNFDR